MEREEEMLSPAESEAKVAAIEAARIIHSDHWAVESKGGGSVIHVLSAPGGAVLRLNGRNGETDFWMDEYNWRALMDAVQLAMKYGGVYDRSDDKPKCWCGDSECGAGFNG